MVFVKYKSIKRDLNKRDQQKRLNWFMAVVKSKKFGNIWLKRTRERIEQRKKDELEK